MRMEEEEGNGGHSNWKSLMLTDYQMYILRESEET